MDLSAKEACGYGCQSHDACPLLTARVVGPRVKEFVAGIDRIGEGDSGATSPWFRVLFTPNTPKNDQRLYRERRI